MSKLKGMEQRLIETNMIADDILLEQETQVEQLQNSLKNVKETQEQLKNAKAIISYFRKELVKDKLWIILLFLIVVVLIFMTIEIFANQSSSSGVDPDYLNGYN